MYGYIGRNYELEKWFKFNNHISIILDWLSKVQEKTEEIKPFWILMNTYPKKSIWWLITRSVRPCQE